MLANLHANMYAHKQCENDLIEIERFLRDCLW